MERGALLVGILRTALYLTGAVMLGYATRVYFTGIHWRLPDNPYRWLIPGVFASVLLLFLRAAIREFRRLLKGLGR